MAGSASGPRCARAPSAASPSSHTPGLHLSWSLGFALRSARQTPPGPDFQTVVRLHLSSVCVPEHPHEHKVPRPLLQHAPLSGFLHGTPCGLGHPLRLCPLSAQQNVCPGEQAWLATFTATSAAVTAGSTRSSTQYVLVECESFKNNEEKECWQPLPQGKCCLLVALSWAAGQGHFSSCPRPPAQGLAYCLRSLELCVMPQRGRLLCGVVSSPRLEVFRDWITGNLSKVLSARVLSWVKATLDQWFSHIF